MNALEPPPRRVVGGVVRDGGPYVALAGLVAGIAFGERLGPGTGRLAIGAAAVVAAVVVAVAWSARARPGRSSMVLLAIALALLGAALSQRARHGQVRSPLSAVVAVGDAATIDAVLVEDPAGPRFSTQVLGRVQAFRPDHGGWRAGGGRTVLVAASGDVGTRLGLLDAGDHVRLRGSFGPLEGFDERWRWRHAVGRFDADLLLAFRAPTDLLASVANAARDLVLGGSRWLPPTERALLAGFLLGDTRSMPPMIVEQFRAAGMSHLLAVSGANVAFVLALVGPVLRRLPRAARLVAMFGVLAGFGAMTRWEPSVLRAGAMAACAVVALHVGRPARATRTLALGATALLVVDPFLVHSVGFLLSCGASLGIAWLGPPLARRLRGPAWFTESLSTTLAAQIGVAPVLLPVFGSMPLIALPANLAAVPIAGPLTVWGLGAGALGGLVGRRAPELARVVQLPTRWLADAVLGIADAASRVPLALDVPMLLGVTAAAGLAVLVGARRRLRRHALVVPPR